MFRAARDCYNILVKHVRYLQQNHHPVRACRLLAAQGLSCPLNEKPESGEHAGNENALCPIPGTPKRVKVSQVGKGRFELKPNFEIETLVPGVSLQDEGGAWAVLQSLCSQKSCAYPKQIVEQVQTRGKAENRGRVNYKVLTHQGISSQKVNYGMSAKSASALARVFDGHVSGFFTHLKNGNYKAKLPCRTVGYYPIYVSKEEVKWKGEVLSLGTKQHGISLYLPGLKHTVASRVQCTAAKITKNRSGHYYLHLTTEIEVESDPSLVGIGAIDLGQKRAMVIASSLGETATINGKEICAIKRERDRRYRGINRLRSRTYRGQVRQYLSPEEQQKAWIDTRYGWRMIRARRREGIDGKGRSLVELGQQRVLETGTPLPLRKRSKRQFKLLQTSNRLAEDYQIRLNYANHCITRKAVDWAQKNKIGKLYVGDLDNLPKGRKKGKRRIKQVHRNSLWEWPTQIKYLDEKLKEVGGIGVEKVSEKFSSQICPQCGRRHKPRNRIYYCNPKKDGCGWRGDRDCVGAVNILNQHLQQETGARLMPARNQNLRLAPATRKIRIRKARVGKLLLQPFGSNTKCEPVEDAAKGYVATTTRGAVGVPPSPAPKTARNPYSKEDTGNGEPAVCRASDETVARDSSAMLVVDGQSQTTGAKTRKRRPSAQANPEIFIQLSLWDAGGEIGFDSC